MIDYIAAVCHMDGVPVPSGESTPFVAANDADAREKAKNWARSLEQIEDGMLVQVVAAGRGVCSLRQGEF